MNFREFFAPPTINNAGRVAFKAFLTGEGVDDTNDEGLWSDSIRHAPAELPAMAARPPVRQPA